MAEEREIAAGVIGFNLMRLCRYLSERSPQPMVAVDGTTHVVYYLNDAFARLVGRERKTLMGRPFAEAVPEGDRNGCLALLDRVFRTGTHERLDEQEHRQVPPPPPAFWSYSVWAILGADDRPTGVMVQVTDSTETALFRRQSAAMNEALLVSAARQHELAAAAESLNLRLHEAVQSRDHFLAVLSHELRNPLTALTTGLRVLKVGGGGTAAADAPAMMGRQLAQLVRLVDDLLDVSRIATGKLELRRERVDLATVVRDAVEASRPLIDRGGHALAVELPTDPLVLDADPARLTQVFLNLLTNAAKYSEPGGRIRLSAARDGDEAVVSVRDTGIGIPAAHLGRIFDAFVQVDAEWQRAQGGLGIGLSLVKEFVGLHGGRVEAHSDGPGRGSEFVVHLPAAGPAAAPLAALPARSRGPQRRILVVDDNRDAAESLGMLLGLLGHEVRTAYDGAAGVSAAAEFRPDLVLMDLGMPTVDGYEAARRIRSEPWGEQLFLVALTGWGADDDRRRTREAGFDHHLVKPVDPDALATMLADLPVAPP